MEREKKDSIESGIIGDSESIMSKVGYHSDSVFNMNYSFESFYFGKWGSYGLCLDK